MQGIWIVLSPECRTLLERAMREPFVPSSEEMENALCLNESDYAFLNKQDQLDVPVDVKRAYEKLNTPEFRKYARKMSWLSQCLDFGEAFYGVFDKDILREMFNVRKGFYISEEAVVNAVLHKNYKEDVPAEIRVYLDQIQIEKVLPIIEYLDKNREITPLIAETVLKKSKSTTYRYLSMLVGTGYVEVNGNTNNAVYKAVL